MDRRKVRRKSASAEASQARDALRAAASTALERIAKALELGRRGRRVQALMGISRPSSIRFESFGGCENGSKPKDFTPS